MNKKPDDPLSEDLLPKSSLDDDPAVWESRVQDLMSAAAPILAEYRREPVPWWSLLAERLRPRLAVAAAAAAALMLFVHRVLPAPVTPYESSLPLATVVGEGDEAYALWSIVHEEVDPVLALVILEGETP